MAPRCPRLGRSRLPRRGEAGFSLIELLIVVMILAVTMVVVVSIGDMLGPESELNSAASEISASIADARSDAIVCGRLVFFEFALGETGNAKQYFRSIREPLPGREDEADDDEFLLTVKEWKELPAGVRVDAVMIGEQEPWTDGVVSIPIRPDGTMPTFLVRLVAPELDPNNTKQAGWACVQVAGLLGQPRVLNRFVEPEFLREDAFQ